VYLCLNHHWVADFGDEQDRLEILRLIKEITGKEGKKISPEEEEHYEEVGFEDAISSEDFKEK